MKKEIKDYLESNPIISTAIIFGSVAKNMQHQHSDIDIAVILNDGELSFQEKNNIILELNAITSREVDCIELDKVSPVLQMQVIKNGICLFCKDEHRLNNLKIEIIRNYLDLKKVRKPIEDRLKDVSIYG
ncbi:MAG: nucleotidyltransferase domain-containing protein [Candidatus Marinimicrobia bacterium]|nr:nucleotidyltransferase domain-containing protein [Candidatus Neomarinimicrobiota bacterium]